MLTTIILKKLLKIPTLLEVAHVHGGSTVVVTLRKHMKLQAFLWLMVLSFGLAIEIIFFVQTVYPIS